TLAFCKSAFAVDGVAEASRSEMPQSFPDGSLRVADGPDLGLLAHIEAEQRSLDTPVAETQHGVTFRGMQGDVPLPRHRRHQTGDRRLGVQDGDHRLIQRGRRGSLASMPYPPVASDERHREVPFKLCPAF